MGGRELVGLVDVAIAVGGCLCGLLGDFVVIIGASRFGRLESKPAWGGGGGDWSH